MKELATSKIISTDGLHVRQFGQFLFTTVSGVDIFGGPGGTGLTGRLLNRGPIAKPTVVDLGEVRLVSYIFSSK